MTNSTQRVQKHRAKVRREKFLKRREKALNENGVVHFSAWVLETDLPALQKYADNPEVVKLLEEWEKKDG